jgi:hypothetical protein
MRCLKPSPDILAAVAQQFPSNDAATVIALLGDLDSERVQRSILQLAEGDIDRFLHFASRAQQDSRDVIMWADEPRGDDEPKSYEELRARLGLPPDDRS